MIIDDDFLNLVQSQMMLDEEIIGERHPFNL